MLLKNTSKVEYTIIFSSKDLTFMKNVEFIMYVTPYISIP